MATIKIDTDKVHISAMNIRNLNKSIKNAFVGAENAMNQLNPHWDGPASEAARTRFFAIKSACSDARYDTVENFVNFLLQPVEAGYIQTETVNKKLADAFK
jgi:hypothetical protein